MHLLGHHLPDHKLLKIALTSFYGVSHHTSSLLLARLQIPLTTKVSELTEPQVTSLSAFLSSPSTAPKPLQTPLSTPGAGPSTSSGASGSGNAQTSSTDVAESAAEYKDRRDPLEGLMIESDLLRKVQGDIAHLRQVGTYRGRRVPCSRSKYAKQCVNGKETQQGGSEVLQLKRHGAVIQSFIRLYPTTDTITNIRHAFEETVTSEIYTHA